MIFDIQHLMLGGAGVLGIAWAGVIAALEAQMQVDPTSVCIKTVSGVSAGAISAAAYACGHTGYGILQASAEIDMSHILDSSGSVLHDLANLHRHSGLFAGEALLQDMRKQLLKHMPQDIRDTPQLLTFARLRSWQQSRGLPYLYVLATNLNSGGSVVFSADTTPDVEVAWAVRASAGIPLLWFPCVYEMNDVASQQLRRGDLLVDGVASVGIGNMSWVPRDADTETPDGPVTRLVVGMNTLNHVRRSARKGMGHIAEYLALLGDTCSNTSALLGWGGEVRIAHFTVSSSISSVNFALTDNQRSELFARGFDRTRRFFATPFPLEDTVAVTASPNSTGVAETRVLMWDAAARCPAAHAGYLLYMLNTGTVSWWNEATRTVGCGYGAITAFLQACGCHVSEAVFALLAYDSGSQVESVPVPTTSESSLAWIKFLMSYGFHGPGAREALLSRMVRRYTGCTHTTFKALRTQFGGTPELFVAAHNITSGNPVDFCADATPEVEVLHALLAATAIPVLHHPVPLDPEDPESDMLLSSYALGPHAFHSKALKCADTTHMRLLVVTVEREHRRSSEELRGSMQQYLCGLMDAFLSIGNASQRKLCPCPPGNVTELVARIPKSFDSRKGEEQTILLMYEMAAQLKKMSNSTHASI